MFVPVSSLSSSPLLRIAVDAPARGGRAFETGTGRRTVRIRRRWESASACCCDVFVGCMPLRLPLAPTPVPAALARLGFRHFYTVVRERPSGECMYFDFLPANPQSILVAAAVLLGQGVQVDGFHSHQIAHHLGILCSRLGQDMLYERKISRPPEKQCWWIGTTASGKGLRSAIEFNRSWKSTLVVFQYDCRHHTDGLVLHLTGRADVTSHLDSLEKFPRKVSIELNE